MAKLFVDKPDYDAHIASWNAKNILAQSPSTLAGQVSVTDGTATIPGGINVLPYLSNAQQVAVVDEIVSLMGHSAAPQE